VLLAEICALKDRGLTEAIVVDFAFKNIQPLKDRVYPAYLYTRVNDPTWITSRLISEEDMLSRVDLMLRGKISNAGAPLSYSVWNLPPQSPFSEFVSNPPVQVSNLGHRVRPSLEDIEAFIAPYWNLPEEERQTHFQMQTIASEAKVNSVLSMLAGESSDSVHTESVSAATGHGFGEDEGVHSLGSARRKRLRRTSHPAAPAERKKRKKRLWWSSGLELGADPTTSVLSDGSVSANLEDDIENCDGARVGGRVLNEDEEEEEEVVPLIFSRLIRLRVCWYLADWMTTFSRSSSNISMSSSLVASASAMLLNVSLGAPKIRFAGNTASNPYTMKNMYGVSM
jgi:hypothetical protein